MGRVGFSQVLVLDWITWNVLAHSDRRKAQASRYQACRTEATSRAYKCFRKWCTDQMSCGMQWPDVLVYLPDVEPLEDRQLFECE